MNLPEIARREAEIRKTPEEESERKAELLRQVMDLKEGKG